MSTVSTPRASPKPAHFAHAPAQLETGRTCVMRGSPAVLSGADSCGPVIAPYRAGTNQRPGLQPGLFPCVVFPLVKIFDDGKGERQSVEASMTDVDLPPRVNYDYGPDETEALADLRRRVQAYITSLRDLDFTVIIC